MGVLQDKVAIVTAGGGVGREICTAFAKEGARVAVLDIDESAAIDVVTDLESLGAQAIALRCDITDADEITKAVKEAVDWFGTVDILVNSMPAISRDVALEDMTDADFDRALATGPAATLRFMRACHPYLADGGHVINLNSHADLANVPTSAAREWGWHGITVNGLSAFGIHDEATAHIDELDALLKSMSSAPGEDVETDIGHLAVFLAGPDASLVAARAATADGDNVLVA